ncbi:MAG: hypothetical protein NZ765_09165 [Anaerolineae bacterium]|nr:hypothetical protein [Anaerolineae bacterium]MDW8071767.1 hypothetical protein [Anaerolineae bacterium]
MSLVVRIVLTLIVLALLPAYAVLASGEVTSLSFTINPAGGPQGTPITVNGQGAQVGLPVQVMLVTDGETGVGAMALVQVMPDANGNFSATLTVPAEATAGRYAVRAEQRNAQGALVHYYWISFHVGPALVPVTGGWQSSSLTLAGVLAALLVGLIAFQGVRLALGRA